MAQGGDFNYDAAGQGYGAQRRADPRIAEQVRLALGETRTVLNVGAGAGSYEPTDRYVVALEPSDAMRAQRPCTAAPAIRGVAEDLPFDDAAFDAVMAAMTVHQWPDLARGLGEMRRVARGPVVVLCADHAALAGMWLTDYAPGLTAAKQRRYPAPEIIGPAIGARFTIAPVLIPNDCTDHFAEGLYARPEKFLDPAVRRAQSSWSFLGPGEEDAAVARLAADLASGAWDARYGHWRKMPTYDGAMRIVIGWP